MAEVFKETIEVKDADVVKAMNKLIDQSEDGRPAFIAIASDWLKTNKKIFTLKGPGKYEDLTPAYKKAKSAFMDGGSPYPILRGKFRRIEKGLTEKGSEYNVMEVTKTSLTMGVQNAPEAIFNQLGTSKMPKRVFVFNAKQGGKEFQEQMLRWKNIYTVVLQRRLEKLKKR